MDEPSNGLVGGGWQAASLSFAGRVHGYNAGKQAALRGGEDGWAEPHIQLA